MDVRSPSEFRAGHIPGATNVPLFSDEERAEVGTAFRHAGRAAAIQIGVQRVSARLPELINRGQAIAKEGQVLIHCWRGGMRSRSMAQFYQLVELKPQILDGGYKAFRRLVHERFERRYQLRVISGLTGVGKTHVLRALAELGEQVIDLEHLAHHRGSSFGGIGLPDQPTTEQFENFLFAKLAAFNSARPIWVEDEGARIGSVVVPPKFYDQYRNAPAVFLESSRATRVENLLRDYGELPAELLIAGIQRIAKRMDGRLVKTAIDSVESGEPAVAIEIVLDYYDRTYMKAKAKIPRQVFIPVPIDGKSPLEIAQSLCSAVFGSPEKLNPLTPSENSQAVNCKR